VSVETSANLSMQAQLGRKVNYDVTNATGLVLVPAHTVLNQEHLELFKHHRIHSSEVVSLPADEKGMNSSSTLVLEATRCVKELFESIKIKKKIPLLEIKNDLIPIVQLAAEHPDLFQLFESVKAKDEYTHQHNIGVGVLSTLIGRWLNLTELEIGLLSLAATLHDVGKVRISEEILLKPGKLTNEEYDEMKRHTLYGYDLLKGTIGLSPRIPMVALQHHERGDGKGYPLKLKGSYLDSMSRIVAVADVLHAMSSKRPYHEALPFSEVVSQMREGSFGELDPHIVSVFLENMIRNLIGRKVRLTDGRWGEVVSINPHDDTHPLVKVEQSFVDLSKDRQIHIMEVIV
jgi:HD-GYP domain-containing protein (c-di-GMP phosphodiesterase class II)